MGQQNDAPTVTLVIEDEAFFFETERAQVRRYETAAQRRVLAADPEVRRFSLWPDATDAAFAVSVAAMRDRHPLDGGGWMNLAIHLREGPYAGDHGLLVEDGVAKLGIALMPASRGLGLAREVLAGSLALLRRHGIARFHVEIDPQNSPSLACFARAGFRRIKLDADNLGAFWLLERS